MTGPRDWKCQPEPNGLILHMRSWGDERGRPLIISHGFLEQCAAWDQVANQLNRWVITYDQRGHGLSEHIGPDGFYHFFDYVADLDGIVRHLGQPIDLVGHSMGGTIACLFAAIRPKCVENLVLIEGVGPPDTTEQTVQRGRQFLDHRHQPPSHTPLLSLEDGVQRMRRFNPALTVLNAERLVSRHTRKNEDGSLSWRWDARHRSRSPRPFALDTFKRYLNEIQHPTLLIFGEESFYKSVPDLQERIDCFENSDTVYLKGVGHHPHQACPDILVQHISHHCKGP